ncbi:hypothetical protein MUK42_03504 [Musa troglodytarum]|uniref:Uncharacterized protein n=1 Tax=Musa troglodytarum TaxID=320322 RepID=A0A9E7K8T9_9LILI|nr:hypothetical protein MUK42_03504 [Musa troglodytarum]
MTLGIPNASHLTGSAPLPSNCSSFAAVPSLGTRQSVRSYSTTVRLSHRGVAETFYFLCCRNVVQDVVVPLSGHRGQSVNAI